MFKSKFQKKSEEKLSELRKIREEKLEFKKKLELNLKNIEKQISEYEGAIIVLHELITGEKVE